MVTFIYPQYLLFFWTFSGLLCQILHRAPFFNNNVFTLFIPCHADFKLGCGVIDDTKKSTHTSYNSDVLEKYIKKLLIGNPSSMVAP